MNIFKRSKLTRGEIGWGGGVKKKLKRRIGSCFTEAPSSFLFTSRPGGPHLVLPSDQTLSTPAHRELLIEPRK